jgi:branched-subunit amino acid aminotransferase/4-amino-4-deoxychorismate lyase
LEATTRDEYLSQQICERLLKVTTDFYIDTKTKRLKANIDRLQKRADSLGIMLDRKTYATAEANQLLLDANPAYASPQVDAEISTRNKYLQATVFAEIVKNLEISKTALIQETPTIQVIDRPEMPLKKNEWKWWEGMLVGGIIGTSAIFSFLSIIYKRVSHPL